MAEATSASRPSPRPRRFVPRFSLAAALIAMTLCAVGLWYWYRVPFEVEHHVSKTRREVETVRRTWGGTVRHGTRRIYIDGKLLFVENYRDGQPHGKWEWFDKLGKAFLIAEFHMGRLESIQGNECDLRLAQHLAQGTLDDQLLAWKVVQNAKVELVETRLQDAMEIISDFHLLPIHWQGLRESARTIRTDDQRAWALVEAPITVNCEGPLIVVLGKLLQPLDLVCDYRYGMLWIAEREEAANWKDPTGVCDIVPARGSALETAWKAPISVEFIENSLVPACKALSQQNGGVVEYDWSPLPRIFQGSTYPGVHVTLHVNQHPFKHTLGMMLEQVGCQARLEGQTIVIEPQPGHASASY